jgi:hypothetical protein
MKRELEPTSAEVVVMGGHIVILGGKSVGS